ncbi:MAG: hypothetical protein HF314_13615 [Ignavibacteria bacterium]|jgi:hypothetical protein|nr:hypothetical protein [Ignavibacteria bacterium]MCU7504115.1 hypothetical protein [Ignavibacteria bacterium]MCU7516435.1 hypothetical protein [Ignavibacteria bacterium]
MKSQIFTSAIYNRFKIKFLYGLQEVVLDPYFLSYDKNGQKVIYGKTYLSNEIKKYEFARIANIKILDRNRFSPVLPIASRIN